jgi:hypothetical protein
VSCPISFLLPPLHFFLEPLIEPVLMFPRSSPLERRTVCPVCFNDCAGVFDCPCVESYLFHTAGGECWNTAQPFYDFALTADCTGPETGIQVFSKPDCNGDSVVYNLDAGYAAPGFIGGLQSLWFLPVQTPDDASKVKRDAILLSVEGRDMREESPKVALGDRFVKTEANKVAPITQNDTALISRYVAYLSHFIRKCAHPNFSQVLPTPGPQRMVYVHIQQPRQGRLGWPCHAQIQRFRRCRWSLPPAQWFIRHHIDGKLLWQLDTYVPSSLLIFDEYG